jgi:preprotein translocase subunit YajC
MEFSTFAILDNAIVIDGDNQAANQSANTAQATAQSQAQTSEASTGGSGSGMMIMVIYIIGLIALFYFFAIRPQKKREKELQTMQNSIKTGDWVMTSSGFYGKVVDITEQVFIVEFGTNKSVCIPVRKSEILGNKEPNLTNKPSEDDTEKK